MAFKLTTFKAGQSWTMRTITQAVQNVAPISVELKHHVRVEWSVGVILLLPGKQYKREVISRAANGKAGLGLLQYASLTLDMGTLLTTRLVYIH